MILALRRLHGILQPLHQFQRGQFRLEQHQQQPEPFQRGLFLLELQLGDLVKMHV